MGNTTVNITLEKDEALILFEFLSKCNDYGAQGNLLDEAEERAVWNLQAALEGVLIEPFDSPYTQIIQNARGRVLCKPPASRSCLKRITRSGLIAKR